MSARPRTSAFERIGASITDYLLWLPRDPGEVRLAFRQAFIDRGHQRNRSERLAQTARRTEVHRHPRKSGAGGSAFANGTTGAAPAAF
jgi:hypothetical protein